MSKKTNVENIETTEETSTNAEVTDTEELTDVKGENVEETDEKVNDTEVVDNKELTDTNDNSDNDNSDIEVKEEYIVVYPFLDLIDGNYEYKLNSKYPREDISDEQKKIALSEERINQLTTLNNRIGKILISKSEN